MSGISVNGFTPYDLQRMSMIGPEGRLDPKKHRFDPKKDFKPGIYDPEQQAKVEKRKKNIKKALLITAGVAIAGVATWFFTKGKGKEWVKALINKFKGSGVDEVVKTTQKAKVKTQAATVAEHVNLAPGEKVKMAGKEAARKVRRSKKAIIEATRLREEAEKFTEKELQEYARTIAYKAPTEQQAAFIAKNNKPATNTIADFVEKQSNENLARVAARRNAQKAAAAATQAAPVATQIAELQAKIAKQEAAIAKYSANPAMARYAKPYETAKAALVKELEQLQATVRAAA